MKKYKLETKIGQIVTLININIRSEADRDNPTTFRRDGIYTETYKIVFQTKRKIAISNEFITTFDREVIGEKNKEYSSYIGDPRVRVEVNEKYFPNGVFGEIFTTGSIDDATNKLVAYMQNELNKKYGFLCNINIGDIVEQYKNNNYGRNFS